MFEHDEKRVCSWCGALPGGVHRRMSEAELDRTRPYWRNSLTHSLLEYVRVTVNDFYTTSGKSKTQSHADDIKKEITSLYEDCSKLPVCYISLEGWHELQGWHEDMVNHKFDRNATAYHGVEEREAKRPRTTPFDAFPGRDSDAAMPNMLAAPYIPDAASSKRGLDDAESIASEIAKRAKA